MSWSSRRPPNRTGSIQPNSSPRSDRPLRKSVPLRVVIVSTAFDHNHPELVDHRRIGQIRPTNGHRTDDAADTGLPIHRPRRLPGATPRFSGLERHRRGHVDHTPPPPPRGSLPVKYSLREGVETHSSGDISADGLMRHSGSPATATLARFVTPEPDQFHTFGISQSRQRGRDPQRPAGLRSSRRK